MKVAGVEAAGALDLDFEVRLDALGEEGYAVLIAFSVADEDVVVGEVNVFDAEAKGFGEAQSAAVEQLGYQPRYAVKVGHKAAHFVAG